MVQYIWKLQQSLGISDLSGHWWKIICCSPIKRSVLPVFRSLVHSFSKKASNRKVKTQSTVESNASFIRNISKWLELTLSTFISNIYHYWLCPHKWPRCVRKVFLSTSTWHLILNKKNELIQGSHECSIICHGHHSEVSVAGVRHLLGKCRLCGSKANNCDLVMKIMMQHNLHLADSK